MSNRRFEMHQYRQILARMRLDETDRSISRAGLMGRKKAGQIGEIAEAQGWLNSEAPCPKRPSWPPHLPGRPTCRPKVPWFYPMP
jgi:hypothetical protein